MELRCGSWRIRVDENGKNRHRVSNIRKVHTSGLAHGPGLCRAWQGASGVWIAGEGFVPWDSDFQCVDDLLIPLILGFHNYVWCFQESQVGEMSWTFREKPTNDLYSRYTLFESWYREASFQYLFQKNSVSEYPLLQKGGSILVSIALRTHGVIFEVYAWPDVTLRESGSLATPGSVVEKQLSRACFGM